MSTSASIGGAKKKPVKKPVKKPRAKKPRAKTPVTRGGLGSLVYAEFPGPPSDAVIPEASHPPIPVPPTQVMADTEDFSGGAKRKKAKKTKRKPGPYALFVKKHYATVAKKHPQWKATDCIKEIAKMWKNR